MGRVNKRQSVVAAKDDAAFNKSFVAAIRNEPCLYDFQLFEYCSKPKQQEAWKRLSNEFGESVQSLKDRWKNLRAALTRQLRYELKAEKSGGKLKTKPYYLLEDMQFLIPYTRVDKPSNVAAGLSARDSPQSIIYVVSETENQEEEAASDVDNNTEYEILDDRKEDEETINEPFELVDNNTRKTRSNRAVNDKATAVDNFAEQKHITKTAKSPPESTETPQLELKDVQLPSELTTPNQLNSATKPIYDETPEWDFFRSLMPDIQTMTAPQKRKMRMKFIGVIDDILVGEYI